MGNTLSKKIDNNGKIWLETIRNFKIGCMFGIFLTLLKYRRQLYRIFAAKKKAKGMKNESSSPSQSHSHSPSASPISDPISMRSPTEFLTPQSYKSKSHSISTPNSKESSPLKLCESDRDLLLKMLVYGIKFPLFIAGFSIIFKKLIRMNYISSALDVNTMTLPEQKHSIALMSFLLAYSMQVIGFIDSLLPFPFTFPLPLPLHFSPFYIALFTLYFNNFLWIQKNVGIFHWKWSLLLLIRALYGWVRVVTPEEYRIFTVQDLHTLVAMIMGVYCAAKYSKSLPQSIKSTYQACYGYDQSKWVNFFASHSRSLPSCQSTTSFHEEINGIRESNCLKAYWKDSLLVVCPHSFKFFMKLHLIAAMLGGGKFIKDIRTIPLTVVQRVTRNALKSTVYWAFGVHAAVRCCTCFNRKFVQKFYVMMDRIMGTEVNEKYAYCNERNIGSLFLLTLICGRYNVLAEPAGRRSEIVISLFWYEFMHLIRRKCGLETHDDDSYHWLLGANSFASILLSTAVFVNMYVYCRDASYLKSMERRLIAKYLIE